MINVSNLTVELISDDNFYILRDFNLSVKKGEILGIAGESGSGKSVFAKTLLGLNKKPVVKTNGTISLNDNILNSKKDFENIRGKKISMIFQNPQSSLNPVMTIGSQLIETIKLHHKNISKKDAYNMAVQLLKDVEIDMPEERMKSYPHQFSGGMNQRVMTAIALASEPEILIADEPTTALDVTIQEQIIKLIKKLNKEKNLTIIFISHDLMLLSVICHRIAVLYCGELMEILNAGALAENLQNHPYTDALKKCIPEINKKNELISIKGMIGKNNFMYNEKCIFADRCNYAKDMCFNKKPVYKNNIKCHYPLNNDVKVVYE